MLLTSDVMQILLLENTRFHVGDEGNDHEFAKAMAEGVDAFVNDAFGVCHRDQTSVTAICEHVPKLYMGLLVKAELQALVAALDEPARCVLH
jgi:phosphoglycerate kinase